MKNRANEFEIKSHIGDGDCCVRSVSDHRIFLELHSNLEYQEATTNKRNCQHANPQKFLDNVKVRVDDEVKSMNRGFFAVGSEVVFHD
jgi:hypothetical protein